MISRDVKVRGRQTLRPHPLSYLDMRHRWCWVPRDGGSQPCALRMLRRSTPC
jgi:hypothetical protein